jgi:hypothetical protein
MESADVVVQQHIHWEVYVIYILPLQLELITTIVELHRVKRVGMESNWVNFTVGGVNG